MEKLDQILKSYVAGDDEIVIKDKLLCAGFVVVNKNGVLYSGAAGRLGINPTSPSYSTNSIQWIASMTKVITATCLLQLVEKGLVSLDEDLRPKVPELGSMQILEGFDDNDKPILRNNTQPLTLRHLLTHSAGTPYDLAEPDLIKWSASVGRTANSLSWSREGLKTPLKFSPGSGWVYGTAYDWLGEVLSALTGQRLSEYMDENIFTPLGMTSTTFSPERIEDYESRAVVWAISSETRPFVLQEGPSFLPLSPSMDSGGAGLFGTADDYGKFLLATIQGKLLRSQTYEAAFSPQLTDVQRRALDLAFFAPELPEGTFADHGLAGLINMEDIPGRRKKGSLMWSGMSNGRWWIDLKSGVAAVMTTQLQPYNHPLALDLYKELEEGVYDALQAGHLS